MVVKLSVPGEGERNLTDPVVTTTGALKAPTGVKTDVSSMVLKFDFCFSCETSSLAPLCGLFSWL